MAWDILIRNIKGLVQVRDHGTAALAGNAMASLPILENSYLVIQNGLIEQYGSMNDLPATASAKTVLDASGRFVFPSFVDSHTHLIFAASREEEFVMKIKGATYEEIAASGGGILNLMTSKKGDVECWKV